jgi:hypothetical protein
MRYLEALGHGGQFSPCRWLTHEQTRFGIAHEIVDLGRGVGGVERDIDGAGSQTSQV